MKKFFKYTLCDVSHINGHTVYFAKWECHHEKYLVISDYNRDW